MTDRQKAKAIIKKGGCIGIKLENGGLMPCNKCPLDGKTCEGYENSVKKAKEFLDNEWTELDITNLPPDILTWKIQGSNSTHEVEYYSPKQGKPVKTDCMDMIEVLTSIQLGGLFRYRKIEKDPTVEEQAKRWYSKNLPNGTVNSRYIIDAFIAGRESADT